MQKSLLVGGSPFGSLQSGVNQKTNPVSSRMDSLSPDHQITIFVPQPQGKTCLFPNKHSHTDISDQRKPNLNVEPSKIWIIYRSLEKRGKLRERLHRGRRAVKGDTRRLNKMLRN